jgi:hypothetical protein
MSDEQSMDPASPPSDVHCGYGSCQRSARVLLVLEVGETSIERALCSVHEAYAAEVALRYRAMTYRVHSL